MVVDVGGLFTALAGNPPVNSADSDIITVMPTLLTGLVLGWILVRLDPDHRTEAVRARATGVALDRPVWGGAAH
jgi:hypothetical protein